MAVHIAFTSFAAVGVQVTSGVASAFVAIPVAANGALPKFIRIQSNGFVYVKLGATGVVATTNDYYISPNNPEVVVVHGAGFIAYLQDTTGAKISIAPLEA